MNDKPEFTYHRPIKRRPGKPARFADVKVGDQLVKRHEVYTFNDKDERVNRMEPFYYVVTDTWFDPVAGQLNEYCGQMVGVARIDARTGEVQPHKRAHTRMGLASNGFRYADIDFIAAVTARNQGLADGSVIGIGVGRIIRARPKLPAPRF